ncbi:hypothetical protein Zm00014a_005510 [Zea mays]|uniref:Uncharacterized protein n=1 Tax=Zea mays TaxID=4577 RepID=A0A3L6FI87_MAIZE|nr:hypothetical protein Zm00014a_005510 [Zea mays]
MCMCANLTTVLFRSNGRLKIYYRICWHCKNNKGAEYELIQLI